MIKNNEKPDRTLDEGCQCGLLSITVFIAYPFYYSASTVFDEKLDDYRLISLPSSDPM